MNQQLRDWAKEALEMLNDNHHLVADNEKHRYVMMHLDVIKRGKVLLEQPEPVFCEYCGGNDDADFGLPTDHCTDCARPQPAQPESVQEPMFYWDMDGFFVRPERAKFLGLDVDAMQALYATPPAQPTGDNLTPDEAQPSTEDSSEVDHADELTIAYLDGVHTGKRLVKREWVGLTYEEAKEIYTCIHGHDSEIRLCRAIEAKLREKNGGGA